MKKHIILWLLLLLSGSAWAQLSIRESFETVNGDYGYTSSFSNTPATQVYFTRTTNPKTGFGNPVQSPTPDGSWFWAAEGVRDFNRTIPAATLTLNGIPNAGNYNNIKLSILVTDPRGSGGGVATSDEHMRIQYAYTSTNAVPAASSFQTVGEFRGLNAASVSSWYQFVGSTQGPALTTSLTNFDFPIPSGTGFLFVRVEVDQNQSGAELGFDNLRVTGTQATASQPTLATTNTGDVAYTEGAAATAIFSALTANNPSGATLDGAKVVFISGRVAAQDELTYTIPSGSGITFDAANSTNGALAFTGSSSETNYQDLLLSVRYRNTTSTAARGGTRTFAFTVSNSGSTSGQLTRNVVVTAMLNNAVGLAVPFTVDFETDGEGTTYGSNTATSGTQGFVRLTGAPGATYGSSTVFSQVQGSGYFYGKGTKEFFLPASSDGLPTAGNNIATPLGGVLQLAPVNTTGFTNLHFKLKAAATSPSPFSTDDFLRFSYNLNTGAGWQAFPSGNFTGLNNGGLRQDGSASGLLLTTTMQDVDIALPAAVAGTNVSFRVEVGDNGGEEIAFDNIQITGTPQTTVNSIVRANANPTNAATVNYTVTFGAPVTGLTASNFTLTTTGVSGASVGTPVAGAGNTWTVPVNTGTGNGSLTLNLANDTNLSVDITTTLPFAGETYTFDKTAPTTTISSSTPGVSNGGTTATTPIAFAVTFSESVLNFVQSDVQVAGGTISGFTGSGSTYTFNVTPIGSGSTVTVNVAANVATDAAGNGNTAASQFSVTYQQPLVATAQNVTVNLAANGTATLNASSVNNGSTGPGTLTYTIQKIAFGYIPESTSPLTLTTPNGANFTQIRFASYGTPNNNINGNYSLGSCNAANSLAAAQNAYVGRSSGSLYASNTDTRNNPILGDPCGGTPKFLAVQAGYSADAASLTYDCTEATKTQYVLLTVSNGTSTSTQVAQVTVNPPPAITISAVNPTSAQRGATVAVTGTNLSGVNSVTVNGATATVSSLSANGFSFVVPTGATFGAGSLAVAAPCSQTVTSAFTVQVPPLTATVSTTSASPTSTSPLPFSVNFSQSVGTSFTASDVTVAGGTLNTASFAGSGPYTFTVTPSGTGTVTVSLAAGVAQDANNTQNSASNAVSVQFQAPTITLGPASLPNGTQGTAYSQAITASGGTVPYAYAVTAGALPAGLLLNLSNGTVSGTPTTNGTFNFTITATDASTAPGPYSGARSYSLTIAPPPTVTVVSVTRLDLSPTATAQVRYQVVFSGSVSGVTVSNFSVNTLSSGVSGASVSSTSGSGTTYTVTVNTGTGDGTLLLNVANTAGITPTASNVPYTAGEQYTIIKNFAAAPTLRIQAAGSASGNGDVTAFVDVVQVLQSGTSTVVPNGLQNGSFETNNVPANGFKKTADGVVAAPWSFTGTAGVARYGSPFDSQVPGQPQPLPPNGDAVALIQSAGNNNASLSQNLAVPTGSYQVNFQTAQRYYTSVDQRLNVFVNDGINDVFVGSIQSGQTPAYAPFTSATFNVFAPVLTATVSGPASPTSTSPLPFSVSFSQSVGTSFTASDVTVSGGTLTGGSFSGSGAGPYTFTVTPSGTGTVTVSLAAGVASDANNTNNTASNAVSVQYTQPVTAAPVITAPANGSLTNQAVTISGTAPAGSTVLLYVAQGGTAVSGSPFSVAALANGSFSFGPTALPDGTFTVYATAQTAGALVSANSNTNTFTVDATRPTVVLTSSSGASGSTNVAAPFSFTATFSEGVSGFVSGDLSVTNGTVTSGPTVVTGTTPANSTYTFTVTPNTPGVVTSVFVFTNSVQDAASNGNTASNTYSLTSAPPVVTVAPASGTLTGGTVGVAYSQTFTASGATAPYSFAITVGALPAGLTLTAGGTLAGTPTAGGTFNFTVRATDASATPGPYNGTRSYTLTITAPTIVIAPTTLPNGTVAAAYSQTLTASGGTAPYSYALISGALPAGLSLTGNTISGTPTASGTFNFTVAATDASTGTGAPYSGARAYTLIIGSQPVTAAPVITSPANNSFTNQAVTISGTAPANSAVVVYVSQNGGALQSFPLTATAGGTFSTSPLPLASATYQAYATAQNPGEAVSASSNTNTFTVDQTAPTVTLTSTSGASGSTNVATPFAFTATFSEGVTGFVAGDIAVTNGSVTSGPTVVAGTTPANSTYTFSVTPTTAGTVTTVTVSANSVQDAASNGNTASGTYSLTSPPPTLTVAPTNGTLTGGTVGMAYSQTFTATGGNGTYTYSLASGTLPAGLVLAGNGTLSGTPTAGGPFAFTVRATDTSTPTAITGTQAYTLTIGAPTITLTPNTLLNGTQGTAYSQTLTASGGTAPYSYALISGALPTGLSLTGNTISGIPSASGTFNFTVAATDASTGAGAPYSGSRAYSLTIASPTSLTWNGSASTDWFTTTNWTPNVVPTANTDAIIPTAPSGNRFPVISSGTADVRNLSISSGATISQSNGTLTLAADLTNNGTFAATGGTVVLGTSAAANIFGSSPTRFWNLTTTGNTVTIATSAGVSIQRVLTNASTFNTNGNPLLLESNAAGTALVVNPNSSGTSGTSITVQRYISPDLNPGLGYRHLSSPTVSLSNTTGTMFSDLSTASFTPVVNPAYNTSATPTAVTPFPTVYGYDQSRLASATNNLSAFDKGWVSPNALSDRMTSGTGYTVNVGAGETVSFKGGLGFGAFTKSLTRNAAGSANNADAGWQLLGNPYPSPLDYSLVAAADRPNLDAAIYVFESTAQYVGTYRAYVNGLGGNPILPMGQGFFARVSSGQTSGSLTFRNTQRVTTYQNPTYHRGTAETRPLVQLTLSGAAAGAATDEAYVYFEAGATAGVDAQYDAVKLPNTTGLNLASVAVGQQLAINGLPTGGATAVTVPLSIGLPTTGTYTLRAAQVLNFGSGAQPFLRDLQLGTLTDLSVTPTYTFTMNAANTTPRFELVFGPAQVLGTASAALAAQVAVFPNPASKAVFVELPAALRRVAVTAALVDALGRVVLQQQLPAGLTTHTLPLTDVATGVYSLRLQTSAGAVVKKLVVE
ncbi:putative Ig domain-containing protein [Hymenobacter convexus]|uniref:putative Ig domain-containing protein n=1 Tax=Hymenobacter sp. CA1UV-4 TaxID=3063782 RepID=UPI002712BDEB|nr:putative Ig domain-containing protein [Hymenobacter sp. CA1UV-4]MDO7851691.1 putative Ig domain-containing protein [Hymenobacter sp. CA1UV-4]